MARRIGLFQFELSHPRQAPHIGMCLFIPDLLEDGHQVEAALVARSRVEQLIETIEARGYDLVGLDSVFPIEVIGRIKQALPDVRLVVGGINALSLFLESPADFAIVGPGRRAMRALAAALDGGGAAGALDRVPNLFYRRGATIDHSGVQAPWDLETELFPYRPYLDWDYLGEDRPATSNVHQLSVVPEFGCVYQQDALAAAPFTVLDPAPPPAQLLADRQLTPRAERAIRPFLDNNRGCSFCVFRFQDLTLIDVERTVEIVVRQIRHLHDTFGAKQISLQTENPFRTLRPLLERLRALDLRLDAILLRTMPAILLHKIDEVRRCLDMARADGLTVVIQQLGFENFDQKHLDLLNKGISPEENRAAARLLTALKREYGDTLDCYSGHGLILFDPWTTVEDLARNVEIIDHEAPFLSPAVGLQSRLVFYDRFNPIFRKARREGLVFRSERDFGWEFRFADPRTTDFVQMVMALNRHVAKRLPPPDPGPLHYTRRGGPFQRWIFRQVLRAYLAADGDAARLRQSFFEIGGVVNRMLGVGSVPPSPAQEPFRRPGADGGAPAPSGRDLPAGRASSAEGGKEAVDAE